MKVTIIKHTPEPEKTIAMAARLCYSPIGGEQIYEDIKIDEARKLIRFLIKSGHHSPIEHISFTFSIEGISRVTSHQIVRHRIASYSQQSQRYVEFLENFDYIVPPNIENKPIILKKYKEFTKQSHKFYLDLLIAGIPKEDARFVLLNAAETKIIVTMNARSLFNFFKVNSCNRSQWEIRSLSDVMLALVKDIAPSVFETSGPNCVRDMCRETKLKCDKPRKNEKLFKL